MTWFAPTLRPATSNDAVAIADYHHRCSIVSFTSLLEAGNYESLAPRVGRFEAWLEPGSDFDTVVAVTPDDVPIGHVTVNGNELVHLFVDPDRQAGGLGRLLLAAGEELLAANGHRDVELLTMVGNEPAIGLYLSAGWTMTDRVEHSEHDGLAYDEHVLVKCLG